MSSVNEVFGTRFCTLARGDSKDDTLLTLIHPRSSQLDPVKRELRYRCCSRATHSTPGRPLGVVGSLVVLLAAVAPPPMFLAMSLTPRAASFTLRPILFVVAVCSCAAEAMLLEISFIWLMIALISSIAVTAPLVPPWIASIFSLISSVAFAVCLASSLTHWPPLRSLCSLSGACSLDGRIQCQQLGLLRDRCNYLDNVPISRSIRPVSSWSHWWSPPR